MLFKRYADPLRLMKTYNMRKLFDFILYVLEQEQEDTLWELWIHSESKESFKDFKSKRLTVLRPKKFKESSREEQEQAIHSAGYYIKPVEEKKGGEIDGNG